MYHVDLEIFLSNEYIKEKLDNIAINQAELTIEAKLSEELKKLFNKVAIEEIHIYTEETGGNAFLVKAAFGVMITDSSKIDNIDTALESMLAETLLEFFDHQATISVTAEIVTPLSIAIRINQEPLTAQNFVAIVSNFTELYTKCWLIAQNEFSDLIGYTQTHDIRLSQEANLIVAKVTHHSPIEIKFETGFSPKDIGDALKTCIDAMQTGIDAIAQVSTRHQKAKLENQARESEIKSKELETNIQMEGKKQEQLSLLQKAEQEYQSALLENEKKRLELLNIRLDIEKKRLEYAMEIAEKMVSTLYPNADANIRDILIQTLLPNLLQLGNSEGLELVLLQSKTEDN